MTRDAPPRTLLAMGLRCVLAAGLLFAALSGCDEEDAPPPMAPTSPPPPPSEDDQAEPGAEAETDACEVLTLAMVREGLELSESQEVDQRSHGMMHPMCTYTLPSAREDQEARSREMAKKVREAMRAGKSPADVITDMAAQSQEHTVVLTAPDFGVDDEEDAQRRFEQAMRMLHEGIRDEERDVEFQMDTAAVEGVGDAAYWTERMEQLSFRDGIDVYHLQVQVAETPEENLALAKKLARRIMAQ